MNEKEQDPEKIKSLKEEIQKNAGDWGITTKDLSDVQMVLKNKDLTKLLVNGGLPMASEFLLTFLPQIQLATPTQPSSISSLVIDTPMQENKQSESCLIS